LHHCAQQNVPQATAVRSGHKLVIKADIIAHWLLVKINGANSGYKQTNNDIAAHSSQSGWVQLDSKLVLEWLPMGRKLSVAS
jgi:hypothetical protein